MTIKSYKAGDKISEHISYNEARCHCGCGQCKLDDELIKKLEQFRNTVNIPCHFERSMYRCPTWNRHSGGSSASAHTTGQACDLDCFGKLNGLKTLDIIHNIFGCRFGIYQSRNSQVCYFHVDVSKVNKLMWISRLDKNNRNCYTYYSNYNLLKQALLTDPKIKWNLLWV